MDWRGRLRELKSAGGVIAVAVTMSGCGGGCCNANPDPCCSEPTGTACEQQKACLAEGGVIADFPVDDMGFSFEERCGFPHDLSVPDLATPVDLAKPHDVGAGD